MDRKHHIISLIRTKAKGLGVQLEADLNHMQVCEYSATPNAAVTGRLFELCYDYTNDDVYINTDGATAWTKILD